MHICIIRTSSNTITRERYSKKVRFKIKSTGQIFKANLKYITQLKCISSFPRIFFKYQQLTITKAFSSIKVYITEVYPILNLKGFSYPLTWKKAIRWGNTINILSYGKSRFWSNYVKVYFYLFCLLKKNNAFEYINKIKQNIYLPGNFFFLLSKVPYNTNFI